MIRTLSIAFLLISALIGLPLISAAESFIVYLPQGTSETAARQLIQPLLPQASPGTQQDCRFVEMPARCTNREQAEVQAKAIEAGVQYLPSLVICNEQGVPFAVHPLSTLKPGDVEKLLLRPRPSDNELAQRRFEAALFLLCAYCGSGENNDEEIAQLIQKSHQLLGDEHCTAQHEQFIGLRCLYPLLMLQYTRAYRGAHTPESEAKLLEAIAALEAARDADRNSRLGREAHQERERLRTARRKARQYE